MSKMRVASSAVPEVFMVTFTKYEMEKKLQPSVAADAGIFVGMKSLLYDHDKLCE